ncbi:MAG: hypothetical protein CM1200mP39_15960 [Dehalococcoidia bacterium]|nr:MAG: hypothetical protein CM1200mP39_15960 [Dehalococcoidia bacterium]
MQHAIAGKAVAFREAMQPEFKKYAGKVVQNAQVLANGLSQQASNCGGVQRIICCWLTLDQSG